MAKTHYDFASISFYGKDTKNRLIKLMNEYKNLYELNYAQKLTTKEVVEQFCEILEYRNEQMKQEFSKNNI